MKKKNETILLLFLLIVILSVITIFIIFVTKNQRITVVEFNRIDYTNINFEDCKKYFDKEKEICYIQSLTATAERTKSLSFCELIATYVPTEKGKIYSEKCKNNILYAKAMETLDSSFCYAINEELLRNSCVDNLFNKQLNFDEKKKLCYGIRNLERRTVCIEEIYKELKVIGINSEYCSKVDNFEKEICLRIL
ncbi:MAG: hypothetical protein QXR30_01635 [Candidatus Woesearchaeota archaeon]